MSEISVDEKIKQAVREAYGAAVRRFIAEPARASCGCRTCQAEPGSPGPSESAAGTQDTAAILHSVEELDELEDRVPNVAEIRPREVVLDLGSGAGADCLLAARKVGPEGRVIGLDMTPEMVKLARRNARDAGATNVEFRYGEIEDMPLPDGSVDLVISSCVINLSPDKDAVFGQAYRVLRPGGRMVVSDIVLDGELPQPIRESLVAWAGCVAGALEESNYLGKIRAAGFTDVEVLSREPVKISEAPAWKLARAALAQAGLPPDALDRTVISASVKARKPA
jgi:arsenite methyltransferase